VPTDREQRARYIGDWLKTEARYFGLVTEPRRFPPPWSVNYPDSEQRQCFIAHLCGRAWSFSQIGICIGGVSRHWGLSGGDPYGGPFAGLRCAMAQSIAVPARPAATE
jgi:hypothetical protein